MLLEPGEIYFDDLSVYMICNSDSSLKKTITERQNELGRLKICSKSIVFEPKDCMKPVIKIPLRECITIKQLERKERDKLTSGDANIILIDCNQYVEMLEGNVVAPYTFKNCRRKFAFLLNYAHIEHCLRRIGQLHRASSLSPAEQNQMIATIESARQTSSDFDPLLLQDLYEKVVLKTNANKITPLVINPGTVLLSTTTLYFQPFNKIEPNYVLKINLGDIRIVTKRRFLLRQVGVELFYSQNNSSISYLYLVFTNSLARDIFVEKLLEQPTLQLDESDQEKMTLRWQNRVLSNYDYLLYLNSVADRTFNDLTQYPVFPWILQDYQTDKLDLEDPKTYRDLTKPVGALNPERLQRLKERYEEMPPPKFLYGSHYSAPGFVLFYLVRKYPHYMLCLQNGRFDHPDRMFNSVQDVWKNVLVNMADFKELVPEFYDVDAGGDFLQNTYGINFGYRHNGTRVGDVILPPWASGPKDFVNKLREALESEYVSANIHHWIDLIFGYKQTGEEAGKADNVFYYLCYEGAVDLEAVSDWNHRHALEIQIMEFGQIPKQVFFRPHPQRKTPVVDRMLSLNTTECVESICEPTTIAAEVIKDMVEVKRISSYRDEVTAVALTSDNRQCVSVSKDSILKIHCVQTGEQERSVPLSNMSLSSVLVLPSTVIAGSWDSTIIAYDVECSRVIDSCLGHDDAVSCLGWADSTNMLFSGSWDCCIRVWQLQRPPPYEPIRPATALVTQLEHDTKVLCLDIDSKNTCLVSGTDEGEVLMWSLKDYCVVQHLPDHRASVNAVKFSPDAAKLVSCSNDKSFKVYDIISGMQVFNKYMDEKLKCLAWDGYTLLIGGDQGSLYLWDLVTVTLVKHIKAHHGAVLCLTMSKDSNTILTGGEDRQLIIWKSVL